MTVNSSRPTDGRVEHLARTAVILPESAHPIREHQLDREALKVLYRLRDAGFKGYFHPKACMVRV